MDEPKRYIRTLAGDMEAVKRGEIPNLAPRGASVPPPAQPAPAPAPLPTVEPIPVLAPKAPAITPLETYAGDFSERVKETQASTATILAAEQDAAPVSAEEAPQKSPLSNILYGVGGVVLLIAGGIGVYLAYGRYLSASAPILLAPTARAPIFVDEREQISGTGTALLQEIEQSVSRQLASGAARLLYLEDASAAGVFSALQLPAPGALLRNISGAQSMAGVVNIGGAQSPFFILSVTAYGETFAGMLQWETSMPRDLAKLFPPYAAPAPSVPAATSTRPAPALTPAFRDEVVSNHDARVYRDAAGRVVLLYGYWNQTTLVIARNAAAFTEIIGRLATSRAQ